MKLAHVHSQDGFATLIALIMVGMLTLIGIAAMSTSDDEVQVTSNTLQEMQAFYAAEAGLEAAAAALQLEHEKTGLPPTIMPAGHDSVNGCLVRYSTVDDGPAEHKVITVGTLTGLHAEVKSYSTNSLASSSIEESRLLMSQTFEIAEIPLFQFFAFYDGDLEIIAGPDLREFGRVHANGDIWVQADVSLTFLSYCTAGGTIMHGLKGPGVVVAGDVLFTNAAATPVTMKEGASWLEGIDPHWYDSSVARWDGRVQDKSHGQTPISLSMVDPTADLHKMIEPADGNPDSYEHDATLKVIDNQAFVLVGGVWVDCTADMTVKGIITYVPDMFLDKREATRVDCLEIDLGLLFSEGYAPSNGVFYISQQVDDWPGVRLVNGSQLDAPLTVVAENPTYIKGDYNIVDKQPAAVIADAVTFLSSAWDDSKSTGALNQRIAVSTSANVSFITGNLLTTALGYNGGLENLPRLLEDWTGKDFIWTGSMVCLWESQQAVAQWGTSFMRAPIRDWTYDSDLDDPANQPPGAPTARVYQRTGWQQAYVGWREDRQGIYEEKKK
ncbi:MAG: pilus assembly PilX N-terminal domain-containing protein [Candidatus Zixiibacteriota bacterium]|nr:MAG: pilus assembly PilX N-terminal domain-containing protein [candidate division Zixibacteria bacterium]